MTEPSEDHLVKRARPNLEGRFWSRVDKRGADECWPWLGGTTMDGYGQIWAGRTVRAHRMSWEIHNGPVPGGLFVLHRCDNPPCVNPAHLRLGTSGDNIADMVAKGRQAKGTAKASAKLTPDQVREIRRSPEATPALARRYGIDPAQVRNIKTGKNWSTL